VCLIETLKPAQQVGAGGMKTSNSPPTCRPRRRFRSTHQHFLESFRHRRGTAQCNHRLYKSLVSNPTTPENREIDTGRQKF
jgi:hypothetical protein